MKDKKYCVVVPLYKPFLELTNDELICLNSIYKNYPKELIYWLIPNSFNMNGYNYIDDEHLYRLDDEHFKSTVTYSKLCLQSFFYEHFKEYEFMLIHQLDAYTIKNNIDYFINLGYDFYGAPIKKWDKLRNGGFCLRRIDKMIDFCNKFIWDTSPEDWFICVVHNEDNGMNVAPIDICWKFSIQKWLPDDFNINKLPMGCHKLKNKNEYLWKKIINLINEK